MALCSSVTARVPIAIEFAPLTTVELTPKARLQTPLTRLYEPKDAEFALNGVAKA